MSNTLKKAVLPVAGLGTRLFPITRFQPKEMLPIYNKPAIQYVLEEALRIGIDNFLFITNKDKTSIENYFSPSVELSSEIRENKDLLDKNLFASDILNKTSFTYVRQPKPLGLGNAIEYSKAFVGEDPFLVMLADDLIPESSSFILKFKACFEKLNTPILAVKRVPYEEISKYGIIEGPEIKNNIFEIHKMYEKPSFRETRSNLAIVGRYILTPDIFDYLKTEKPGVGGEIQLTGALQNMLKDKKIHAILLEDERFDVGTLEGLFLANVAFYLKNSKEKNKLIESIENIIKRG